MILNLIKINITAMFSGIFRNYGKKKKIKPASIVLIGILVLYIAGMMLFSFGAMFYGIGGMLFESGLGWFYFALMGIMVFAVCFIGSIFMVQSQIFSAKDNELLLSMPIKPSAILGGRLAALMIVEYFFESLIAIPAFIVLFINGRISDVPALGVVFFFITSLFVPLLSVALGCLVGWLVALAISRVRRKNIVTLILSLSFLGVYFWLYAKVMGNMGELMINGSEIAEAVRRAVFPAYHFGVAAAEGNPLSFLIFAVIAVAPFALMYALLSVSFFKLVSGGRTAKKAVYKKKALRVSGVRFALLKRELLHYWSQPMYIMNASLGALASVALAVVLIVYPRPILGMFEPGSGALAGFLDPGTAGAIILSALAAVNFVSAPSISLEGKSLWIAKSLPVKSRDILLAKAELHLAVCGIPSLLAAAACIIRFPMNMLQIVLTLILPVLVTAMFSFLGVTLNLAFPRFDWINPVQPVKQGLSGMLSMFGGMAVLTALAIIYALLHTVFAVDIYLLLCAAAFFFASAGLYIYLTGAGSKKFETL